MQKKCCEIPVRLWKAIPAEIHDTSSDTFREEDGFIKIPYDSMNLIKSIDDAIKRRIAPDQSMIDLSVILDEFILKD